MNGHRQRVAKRNSMNEKIFAERNGLIGGDI